RTDLYALGCTLYEMLTGELPYVGKTAQQLLDNRRTTPPPDVRAKRPDVPQSLALALRRLLATKPEERYRTADQVVEELEALPPDPLRGPASRRRLITVVLVLAALALGALLIAQLRLR